MNEKKIYRELLDFPLHKKILGSPNLVPMMNLIPISRKKTHLRFFRVQSVYLSADRQLRTVHRP